MSRIDALASIPIFHIVAEEKRLIGSLYGSGQPLKDIPHFITLYQKGLLKLQELVTRHAWGNTWQRPNIDLRTRSIVTVSMLVALGRTHELKIHARGALNNGVTKEELQEIFLHASVYCGFPAAVDAFRAAAEVVDAA